MQPFNFKKWIDDHRDVLKPPVGNKMVFKDSTFIVMVIGGPNERKDFHINQTDEFFYQLEGNIVLRIRNKEGMFEDIPINEGEIYMLKGGTPHSPQRKAGSIGLVVEKTRDEGEQDSFVWYCDNCQKLLYKDTFHLSNIETQLKECFTKFYSEEANYTCKSCGHISPKA